MAKKPKKATEAEVAVLDEKLDALDELDGGIHDLTPEQLEETSREILWSSGAAFKLRRARKEVRYKLYRLRTEAEGKCSAHHIDAEFRASFEGQPLFKGWRFFGELWDVALIDPMTIVSRANSEQEEWDAVIRAKYPQVTPGGKVVYPDLTVKKRVEAAAKKLSSED